MNSVIEISCLEDPSISCLPGKRALYICSPSDPNGVFRDTEHLFQQRVGALRNSGFEVDIQRNLDTVEKVANYIEQNYPEGLDYLYFRMHGSSEVGELSELPDGRITTELTGDVQERVERICRSVKRGGVLITESCENGKDGSKNLLLHLAKLCRPEVTVIGSRVSNFEVQFHPDLPRHHRCVSNGVDQTRMYYQTSSGNTVEISTELFDALYELIGMGPEAIDLCFLLLGEQDASESDWIIRDARERICRNGQDFEAFKEKLRKISIGGENLSAEWQGYLNHFRKIAEDSLGYFRDLSKLRIDLSDCFSDIQVIYSKDEESLDIPSGERPGDLFKNAYKFLLGMAVLDRYQSIFSLIDDGDHSATSISARCIYALSGLAIHTTRPSASIRQIMGEYIATVKQSFAEAKTQGMLFHWVDSLIGSKDPCVQAKINALGHLIAGLWDTDSSMHGEEELLLKAIEQRDIEAIKNCRESLFVKTLMDNPFEADVLSQLFLALVTHFSNESAAYRERTGINDFRDPILEKRITSLLVYQRSTAEDLRRVLWEAVDSDNAVMLRCISLIVAISQDRFERILSRGIEKNYSNVLDCILSLPQAKRISEEQWVGFAKTAFIRGRPSALKIFLDKHAFSLDQLNAIKEARSLTTTFAHIQNEALVNEAINRLVADQLNASRDLAEKDHSQRYPAQNPDAGPSDSHGEPRRKRRKRN